MDLLADILSQAGLQRRILNQRSLSRGTALRFPCERSIGFHVVTEGEIYLHPSGGGEPHLLRKGDVAFMSRGTGHVVSTERRFSAKAVLMLGDSRTSEVPAASPVAQAVSGAYQFWNDPVHPLFRELPDWFVLRAERLGPLDHVSLVMSLLFEEVQGRGLGSEGVINGLLDTLFVYLVRQIVAETGQRPSTWSHAVADPQIRSAVELLHSDCSHDWTLSELAKKVGLSRAGLAQKFRQSLGDTPLSYVRTLRMQKAMALLSHSNDTLESIAGAVGYGDAFGFSKVFKRVVGVSPRDFRARDRSERDLAWRFL